MERVKGIDGLRALAVLVVFALHAKLFGMGGGAVGVDVFFVISGFVITRSLMAEYAATGAISIRRFYLRRLLRLWPALAVMCAAFTWEIGITWRDWLPAILYVTNFTTVYLHTSSIYSHTWSLAIEEQFYLLWPLVLLCFLRLRSPACAVLTLTLLLAAWRIVLDVNGASGVRIYYAFDTRIDQLTAGAVLAFCSPQVLQRIGAWWPVGMACLGWMLFHDGPNIDQDYAWRIPPITASAALIIAKVTADQEGLMTRLLETPPLQGLGVVSYAFYLWHFPILKFLVQEWGALGCFAATVAFAWGSWILLERPIRENRERVIARVLGRPRQAPQPAPPAGVNRSSHPDPLPAQQSIADNPGNQSTG